MRVTPIADSTFVFEHHDVRLLTDPWVGTTIYGGAWMQYPPPFRQVDAIGRLDFVFISHIHEDHCDPITLRTLDSGATVLIMDRQPNYVEKFLRREGIGFRRVLTIPAYEPVELAPGLFAHVLDADPDHELNHLIDSTLVLTWESHHGERGVYFGNDNTAHSRHFEYLSDVDLRLALLPASGGSGYPACYTSLTPAERSAERDRIQRMYLDGFVDSIGRLRPRWFSPCAGAHVIAGPNSSLNAAMTFLDDPRAAFEHARSHLDPAARAESLPFPMHRGEIWTDSNAQPDVDAAWDEACAESGFVESRERFLAEIASRSTYAHEDLVAPSNAWFEDVFMRAGQNAIDAVEHQGRNFASHLYVGLPSGRFGHVDGSRRHVEITAEPDEEPRLVVHADPKLLGLLLTGGFSWNIADAATFLSYERIPNVYDREGFIALNLIVDRSSRVLAEPIPEAAP